MVARNIDFTHHDSLVSTPVATTRNQGTNKDGEKYHYVKNSQEMMHNSHDILDIKMVILQGGAEQKLD